MFVLEVLGAWTVLEVLLKGVAALNRGDRGIVDVFRDGIHHCLYSGTLDVYVYDYDFNGVNVYVVRCDESS